MDRQLLLAIENAENEYCELEDFEAALLSLSKHQAATLVLLLALRDAAVNHEKIWNEIEEMPAFKEVYGTDRDKAREDFFHEMSIKH